MLPIREISFRNIVVGSGAAGLSAALQLARLGQKDTALVTENLLSGTSRNTGSDKQTYYKLALAGSAPDSVHAMAEDLFSGGCVDGEHALCEAALSARCFYRLVELGVPFPDNEYGEFIGYQTDHDLRRRASSVGPYTSKIMTECLEAAVKNAGLPILDHCQAIRLLVLDGKAKGLLCIDSTGNSPEYLVIWCSNIVLATGGPAGIYRDSVYPMSQIGSSGLAFEAGIRGKNLTEWQFGLASLAPRWNVSGSYMQVLPRFVSTDPDGTNEREFLMEHFAEIPQMLHNTFLKGYQWPFDTNKIFGGSSIIDLLVYRETILRGRKVFLDFTRNPGGETVDFQALPEETKNYLDAAGCCFGTPYRRLCQLNMPAVSFYAEHGVDLAKDWLPIAVCAQHNNGGLAVDEHWQTDISGIYAIGEVAGTHGITRPGGSALNAGQVGAMRAAEHIAFTPASAEATTEEKSLLLQQVSDFTAMAQISKLDTLDLVWDNATRRMSAWGGMIRDPGNIRQALAETKEDLSGFAEKALFSSAGRIGKFYRLRDLLICQEVYLSAMLDYTQQISGSRGSALYSQANGEIPAEGLPESFRCQLDNRSHAGIVQEIGFDGSRCSIQWRPVRPIPDPNNFFETQWRAYRARHGI